MKFKQYLPAVAGVLLILLFFWFKVVRFQALYYFWNDMYTFLQSASSWQDGRPVLYENAWGHDSHIHNNYILLLIGPLIHAWGAYGAFVVQTILQGLSYTLLLIQLGRLIPATWCWTLLLVGLLGPVWFWFNDHPGIGWHPELLYLPLSILYILALHAGRTTWIWLTGALIVLVKEDGALLAGCLQLSYYCLNYLRVNTQSTIFSILAQRHFWLMLGKWAFVFMAGMLFLSYKNHAAEPEPRLHQSLHVIATNYYEYVFIKRNGLLIIKTAILLLPLGLLSLVALWQLSVRQSIIRQPGSLLIIYLAVQGVILVSNWVQGAYYYGTNAYFDDVSLTWPPRFVLNYAFAVAYLGVILLLFGTHLPTLPVWQAVVLSVGLIGLQIPIVAYTRDYRIGAALKSAFANQFDPDKQHLLPDADVRVFKKLVNTIPARSDVYVFDYVLPFFHTHYLMWPTGKQWKDADMAIIPIDDFQHLGDKLPMKKPYRVVKLQAYNVYVTPAYEPYLTKSLQP